MRLKKPDVALFKERYMPSDIDIYIGKRLRRKRRMLSLTQKYLGAQVGVRFQQIQKYECGANSISASRLFMLATALRVEISYFFDGLTADGMCVSANVLPFETHAPLKVRATGA